VGRISAYVDDQGFPQVFTTPGLGGIMQSPGPVINDPSVRAAAAAGRPSTVQIRVAGCGGTVGAGSGFVVRPGFVVTNAHVVAGFDWLRVRDQGGEYAATAIQVDPGLDVAVLAVPALRAPALQWADVPVVRGTVGASLGFPHGQPQLVVLPATVRARLDAVGRDIYGEETVRREILAISAQVEQGDSGGPFVTGDGRVSGVVFAGDSTGDTGYALTVDEVRPVVEEALTRNQEVGVGACRF
jgi:S1-C subfamily serine protease